MQHNPTAKQSPVAAAIPAAAQQKPMTVAPSFDNLPDSAFVRERQLVGNHKRPDAPGLLPFSSPTLWRRVKAGQFPKPIKLGDRITCWRVGDVRQWLAAQGAAQ